MNRRVTSPGLIFAILAMIAPLPAQEHQVRVGGQVRPRLESRSQGEERQESFTSMRVRGQVEALLGTSGRVFIQLQDVRLFGEETNTLGDFSADALDLHQGYLEWNAGTKGDVGLRVGRQAMVLGEQRLVGAVDWTQQGRSFDGARLMAPSLGPMTLDLFAMKLQEKSSATFDFDGEFLGAYGTLDLRAGGRLDLFGFLTRDTREAGTSENTWGLLWKVRAGPVDVRLEGSLQGGERDGLDVSAYMLGASGGISLHEKATLTLWYDHLSGDGDPGDGEVGVFNTLFATNHAYYGAADYFLDIPAHTGGLGLRDAAVKLAVTPLEGTGIRLDLHDFSTAADRAAGSRGLARELDLTLTHGLGPGLTAVGGYSYVWARDGIRALGRLDDDASWAFLMLNAVF